MSEVWNTGAPGYAGRLVLFAGRTITALLVVMTPTASAQPDEPLAQFDQQIEQIEITGQRNSLSLRHEIQQIEQRMFDLFNALNSNDEFDVACAHKTPTGSKLPLWQCEAAFMRDAEAREMAHAIGADGIRGGLRNLKPASVRSQQQMAFTHRQKIDQLNQEMKTLALQHPDLAEAMFSLQARRQQLEEMQTAREPDATE